MNLTAGVMGVTPPEQSELWIYMTAYMLSYYGSQARSRYERPGFRDPVA